MIVAAGLLVLVGLGLFVAGVVTGVTAFYWACVGACALAAVLLVLARRRMAAPAPSAAPAAPASAPSAAPAEPGTGRHAGGDASSASAPGASSPAAAGNGAPTGATALGAAALGGTAAGAAPGARVPGSTPDGGPSSPPPGQHPAEAGEPPIEEVEMTDLLLVVDLTDEVLVVDEHPRYHVAGCRHLAGRDAIPIPLDEARADGFTPCGTCRPDATLADRVRARRNSSG